MCKFNVGEWCLMVAGRGLKKSQDSDGGVKEIGGASDGRCDNVSTAKYNVPFVSRFTSWMRTLAMLTWLFSHAIHNGDLPSLFHCMISTSEITMY